MGQKVSFSTNTPCLRSKLMPSSLSGGFRFDHLQHFLDLCYASLGCLRCRSVLGTIQDHSGYAVLSVDRRSRTHTYNPAVANLIVLVGHILLVVCAIPGIIDKE